jgi:hypothetical protein
MACVSQGKRHATCFAATGGTAKGNKVGNTDDGDMRCRGSAALQHGSMAAWQSKKSLVAASCLFS